MSALTFEYVALDKAGARRKGTTRASDRVEAYRQVASQGLTPLSLSPAKAAARGRRGGVKAKDLVNFTHQFSVLIEARIPIADGLRSIADQEGQGRLSEVVEDVAQRVEAGSGLASAMASHRDVFGETYVETLSAAERTGNMIKVLQYLAEMLERGEESRQAVRGALMYPLAVMSVLTGATIFLIAVVVPKFARMFESRGVDLPPLTMILMALGESFRGYWWAYLGGIAIAFAGARLALRTPEGRLAIDQALHRVPAVRQILVSLAVARFARLALRTPEGRLAIDQALHRVPAVRQILVSLAVARFTRVFGLCLSSGLNLIEALSLAGRAAARPTLQRDVDRMIEQVEAGGRLSEVMPTCAYLPPMARRLLSAGEEAAELTRMCDVVARQHEREAASLTKNIATVIEPLMVVAIAAVVLVVALAIFLPMWGMVNLMG